MGEHEFGKYSEEYEKGRAAGIAQGMTALQIERLLEDVRDIKRDLTILADKVDSLRMWRAWVIGGATIASVFFGLIGGFFSSLFRGK